MKVKLPPNEVLPFCQYHSLVQLMMLEECIEQANTYKPTLSVLINIAANKLEFTNTNIITKVQSFIPLAKKTWIDTDIFFTEWMNNKEKFTIE